VLAAAAIFTAPGLIALSILVVLPPAFRIWLVASPVAISLDAPPSFSPPDQEEPIYSVIAPLRGEARVVDQLLSAIERLNYPPEMLDVIIAVEANDHDTRAAITARKHRIPITVIPIPPSQPATKPKALNVALPFARGVFTVIYDAEDRPERNQLRAALRAFRSGGNDLACVQARLCIDTQTSWLARYFTAEYAAHFDIFLPKLAALGLPLPLGGSSNHFRTETLREVGGWDPYNVTEDADLGVRLARFGYRSGVIDSTTYEEAPADTRRWLGQRIRWFKGWMQTWLVHMRKPRRLSGDLGSAGVLAFQLIVGGNAMVALLHPLFMLGWIREIFLLISQSHGFAAFASAAHYSAAAVVGYVTSAYLGWRGLSHRRVPNKIRILLHTPMHWLLLSLAAWWAAFELIFAPFRWRKTEHGLDEASRQERTIRALLELERHLTGLIKHGELAQIGD
jgi:glycosyltransferase XagB